MSNYQNAGQAPARKPAKVKTNIWEGEGVIRPRSKNINDPIKFYESKTGAGGVIFANMEINEYTGRNDQNGQPIYRKTSVPINVNTNKEISDGLLHSLVSGMTVHAVGRLKIESYQKDGQMVSKLVVDVFVLRIVEGAQPAYNPYGQGQYPPQGYAPQNGCQQPQYPNGYPQQGQQPYAPQYPNQYQQGYNPQYQNPGQYQQQGFVPQPQAQPGFQPQYPQPNYPQGAPQGNGYQMQAGGQQTAKTAPQQSQAAPQSEQPPVPPMPPMPSYPNVTDMPDFPV